MNTTITVVIATYNGEKYIEEQINSILRQTTLPDEIIIVDDGSSDNTVVAVKRILKNTAVKHSIIEHKINKGVNQSFSDGIRMASSEWVMICDQDDVWKNEKIEITKGAIDNNTVLAVCNAAITNASLESVGKSMFDYIKLPIKLDKRYNRLKSCEMMALCLKRNYVTGMCLIGKQEMMMNAIPFPDTMTYDAWLAWNLANRGETVFIQDELVLYRQHNNNAIGTTHKRETIISYYKHRREDLKNFMGKYQSLNTLENISSDVSKRLQEAICFYEKRSQSEAGRLKTRNVIEFWKKGYYEKYSPDSKRELLKDMGMILLDR